MLRDGRTGRLSTDILDVRHVLQAPNRGNDVLHG